MDKVWSCPICCCAMSPSKVNYFHVKTVIKYYPQNSIQIFLYQKLTYLSLGIDVCKKMSFLFLLHKKPCHTNSGRLNLSRLPLIKVMTLGRCLIKPNH